MKWSWKIGEFKGIPIHIHTTFFFLLAWVALAQLAGGGGANAIAGGLLFIVMIFACVLLHEFGHALAARRCGIRTRDITLLPIGGLARLERMPEDPKQELVVALAGPAVNLGLAAVLFVWLQLTSGLQTLSSMTMTTGLFLERMLILNLFLAGFNLLPAFPMDGGRVLRALLALKMNHASATRLAASLGKGAAVAFGFLGFFYNPFLLIIGIFVWIGASQEARQALTRFAVHGVPVQHAMITDYRTLDPRDEIVSAAEHMLASPHQDFPVMDGGRLAGILTPDRLLGALARGGPKLIVGDVMDTDYRVIDSSETLECALAKLQSGGRGIAPVMFNGRLLGLVTAESLGRFMQIRMALDKSGKTLPPARICAC